jgi:riboflavin kinase / FMN adenylyltransferase
MTTTRQTFIRVDYLTEIEQREPTYLAIGSFDGVHLGHQAVLRKMVTAARADGARTAVLTFFPHPTRLLRQATGPYYLMTLADRVDFLASLGVDLIITHPFNDEVRQTRAAHFVDQLIYHLDMRQLWGGDFALGYKREGDVPFLRQLGAERGFTVELVQSMVAVGGDRVSSSRVRHALLSGDVADVSACLGRPFHLCGEVVYGDQRGRTIGFPTANLAVWDELLLPGNGVYATYAWVGEQRHLAATNVGVRPTVNGGHVTVEAHLLDFAGDLYGQTLRLEFISRVRPEKRFSSLPELQAQIQADVAVIREEEVGSW